MTEVYLIPAAITAESLRHTVTTEGGSVNPIQDKDGNWILTQEEWNAPEYQGFKDKYPDLAALFVLIPYNPKEKEII